MSARLWERGGVSEAIAELIDAARGGRGGVLFVEGDAGLGKSSVLDWATALAAPDLRVGLARGDAMEVSLPFGVLGQALDMFRTNPMDFDPHAIVALANEFSEYAYRFFRWTVKPELLAEFESGQ